jgi:hypothetical protein
VIVYDIVMPYDTNWAFLTHLREGTLQGRQFVITAPNLRGARKIIKSEETIYEVVEEGDLEAIVQAVREAAKARAVR